MFSGISVFGYDKNEKHSIYVSKQCCEENHVALLLIGEERKRRYGLIEDFNTLMYYHTLDRGRKHFCGYYLQAFRSEEILKIHIKDCFKVIGKQRTVIPR